MKKYVLSFIILVVPFWSKSQDKESLTVFIGTVKQIKEVKEMGLMYRVLFEVDSVIRDDYKQFSSKSKKYPFKASYLTHSHMCDPKDPYWESADETYCGYPFLLGKKYLIFVSYYHHGSLAISGKSKTRELYPHHENGKIVWK